MPGTIRATTANGDVIFNARTGKVCKSTYRNVNIIDCLDIKATAKNLRVTVDQLRDHGCELVYCTFTLRSGARRPGTPYPYRRES